MRSSYSDGFDLALYGPGQEELETPEALDVEVSAFEFPATLFKGERVVPISTLEARESRFFTGFEATEESLKGSIKPLDNILKSLRTDLLELRKLGFQHGEFGHLLSSRSRCLPLFPKEYALLKSKVVERSAQEEPLKAIRLSLLVDLSFVLECLSHNTFIILQNNLNRKKLTAGRKEPRIMIDGKELQAIMNETPLSEKAEEIHTLVYRHDSIVRSLLNYGWSKKEDEPALIEEFKEIRRKLNALFQEGE
jgi:hypothetical protein